MMSSIASVGIADLGTRSSRSCRCECQTRQQRYPSHDDLTVTERVVIRRCKSAALEDRVMAPYSATHVFAVRRFCAVMANFPVCEFAWITESEAVPAGSVCAL